MRTRRLTLAKETLSELTTGELAAVAGGVVTIECPTAECVTDYAKRVFSRLFYPCLR